jgi:hypothetical protein
MRRWHVVVVSLLAGVTSTAVAQTGRTRWVVDSRTSLAWWQVDPHYEHLWATTCPADPSWQAGEGRDAGLYVDYDTRPQTVSSGRSDPRIPLFPRGEVQPLCRQAVRGEIAVDDPARFGGVRGTVTVIADSLFTGLGLRDAYARRAVLQTGRYPELRFTIDSLVDVQPGDTVRATAVGTFEAHGVRLAARAPLVGWHDSAGLRVRARFSLPATALIDELRMSRWALGMGVVSRRWSQVYMGVDVILRAPGS